MCKSWNQKLIIEKSLKKYTHRTTFESKSVSGGPCLHFSAYKQVTRQRQTTPILITTLNVLFHLKNM